MTRILLDQDPPQSSKCSKFATVNNLNTLENVLSWLFAAENKARVQNKRVKERLWRSEGITDVSVNQ